MHEKENSISNFKAEKNRAQGGQGKVDAIVFANGGIGCSIEAIVADTGEIPEGVSVGDPKNFNIESRGKRRERYPKAKILCTGRANTENFFDLVEYLTK